MWSKEKFEESKRFALLSISKDEAQCIHEGYVELKRDHFSEHTGEIVLCYDASAQFIGELKRVDTEEDCCIYVISGLKKCIEMPCPELGVKIEYYWYSPAECLIPYPEEYAPNYAKMRREGKWREFWLKLGFWSAVIGIALLVSAIVWLLAWWSPFAIAIPVFVLALFLAYVAFIVLK